MAGGAGLHGEQVGPVEAVWAFGLLEGKGTRCLLEKPNVQ